jgi:hypothetical protein
MQAPANQHLVRLLQLTQRELGRKQSERNWSIVHSIAQTRERGLNHLSLARRQLRQVTDNMPFESSGSGSARWNHADKTNRHIGVDCMTFADAKRACLLEPSNVTSSNATHNAAGNCFYSLTFFRTIARQQPTLLRSIARAASE